MASVDPKGGETDEEDKYKKKKGNVEKTLLYGEIVDIFEQAMTDDEVFSNAINEIRRLCKMYKLHANDAIEAIMKALLVLVDRLQTQKYFPCFKDMLDKVLRRLGPVVIQFMGKDVYKHSLRGFRLGLNILIRHYNISTDHELQEILASIRQETGLDFSEVTDDLNNGYYGKRLDHYEKTFLNERQPAMYDDMDATNVMEESEEEYSSDRDTESDEDVKAQNEELQSSASASSETAN